MDERMANCLIVSIRLSLRKANTYDQRPEH
jgi:hypothetical protein